MKVILAGGQEVNSIATNLSLKSTLCTLIEHETKETQELLSIIKEDLVINTVKSGRENRRERRKRERKNK